MDAALNKKVRQDFFKSRSVFRFSLQFTLKLTVRENLMAKTKKKPVKRPKAQFVDQWIRSIRATHIEYGRLLKPATIDRYRRQGYCVVVTMGLVRGRAEAAGDRSALAYYDRLERESQHVYSVSPYRHGATPPPFSFDLSYSYYPRAYVRPGPQVDVYRLDDCTQGYGPRGSRA